MSLILPRHSATFSKRRPMVLAKTRTTLMLPYIGDRIAVDMLAYTSIVLP